MKNYNCSPKQYRNRMVKDDSVSSPDSIETKLSKKEALEIMKNRFE